MSVNALIPAGGGSLPVDQVDWLTISTDGDGNYYLESHVFGAGLVTYTVLGEYTSFANYQAALDTFLATAGFPWIALGTPAADPATKYPVAVNLAILQGTQDGSTGINLLTIYADDNFWFGPSNGYAPFADYAGFQAVYNAYLGGTYTFTNG